MTLNFNQLWRYQDDFLHGIQMTLTLTLIATVAGMLIGLLGALLSNNRLPAVRLLIRSYVEVIRNTPALIQIFLIFFVLPYAGLRLPPFEAAAVALSIYMGAYSVEIFRSGLASIPRSQIEAGQCLGLTRFQVFRHVILLPALRNIYPSLTSQIILILLGSSLASQVSAEELFHTAAFVESRTYRSFEVYAVVCAIYFVMVLSLRLIFAGAERIAFRWPTRR
ncbi:amino acid ABC transporter permease [Roseibium suaedae]|uniref:Amino acid ABC transporter membrane protein 1, PAAT family n=1 Tax=Roseibium suaedae TaxID=735517 RepID=A0A1M7NU58_9HYPH|nr:amino acid ABC transporter permease [Roseibium suaedae]SHN07619.1 amino acid ABC transporter membrane protein 1, PAAT family [Roseibium suaedae]